MSGKLSGQQQFVPNAGWRLIAIRFVLICLASVILVTVARPALAAYVLKYYTATTVNNQLVLEWETVSEHNISAFEILCKEEFQPDDQYHPIGTRQAVGSLTTGVAYNFLVEEGLKPDESYCFRLREVTTDGSPPQYNDICGYGINISPNAPISAAITPTIEAGLIAATPTVVQVQILTPIVSDGTAITIDSLYASTDSGPISISGPLPAGTPTATSIQPNNPPSDATDSPMVTPVADAASSGMLPLTTATIDSATVDATNSPLLTQTALAQGGNRTDSAGENGANISPVETPTPIPTFTLSATPTLAPTITPSWTPTWTPIPTMTPMAAAGQSVALASTEVAVPQDINAQGLNAPVQSTPSYIVVTATSTPLNQTPVTTFTPYPTAVTASQDGLFALVNPTVENLILLTLCFIFLGAGGIGMLGLTATMLYIRSRSEDRSPYQIDQFDIDSYDLNRDLNRRIDRQLDELDQIDSIDPRDDWLR